MRFKFNPHQNFYFDKKEDLCGDDNNLYRLRPHVNKKENNPQEVFKLTTPYPLSFKVLHMKSLKTS